MDHLDLAPVVLVNLQPAGTGGVFAHGRQRIANRRPGVKDVSCRHHFDAPQGQHELTSGGGLRRGRRLGLTHQPGGLPQLNCRVRLETGRQLSHRQLTAGDLLAVVGVDEYHPHRLGRRHAPILSAPMHFSRRKTRFPGGFQGTGQNAAVPHSTQRSGHSVAGAGVGSEHEGTHRCGPRRGDRPG